MIGSLALAGFPLTAGFFSKDEILVSAWSAGSLGKLLASLGLATVLLTAFYSFRLVFVTFWGDSRVDPRHLGHVHEPSRTMTIPLLVLALLSITVGYLGIPGFLAPAFPGSGSEGPHDSPIAFAIMAIATLLGLVGIAVAYLLYVKSPSLPDRLARQWQQLYLLSFNKWYVDEAYDRAVVRPTIQLADRLWNGVDVAVIDGAVNGVARTIAWGGLLMRMIQSGQTQHYALGMTVGAVLILTAYLLL